MTNVNFLINFKPWRCCNHRIRAQSDQIVKQIFLDCRGLWKCKDKDLDWSEASVDGRSVGSVWGNAVSAVGKKSILVFWSQIHLKIPCQPTGTWQICENQYKSDRGREKNHQVAGQVSKQLSDWIFVQKRPSSPSFSSTSSFMIMITKVAGHSEDSVPTFLFGTKFPSSSLCFVLSLLMVHLIEEITHWL